MEDEDFVRTLGPAFLPHVLRRLSDLLVRDFGKFLEEQGTKAPPRTHSTLFALSANSSISVTELAALLKQSHPLIITWIRELRARGLITSAPDKTDRRRTILILTDAGREELERVRRAQRTLVEAIGQLSAEADADPLDGLWRMIEAMEREPLIDRLRQSNIERRCS